MSIISTGIDTTVIVGSAAYSSPLTITNTGRVYGPTYGATGVYENGTAFIVTNYGGITGGAGAITGIGGLGVDLRAGSFVDYGSIGGGDGRYGGSGNGGSGGVGVLVSAGGSLVLESSGTIIGGSGPRGEYVYRHSYGGAGVDLTGGTLTTAGSILGGRGDAGGGAGVNATNATLINTGSITGGGGSRGYGGAGAGVVLNGSTLTTSGIISGGDAVQFGAVASTLIVDPGAVFNGQVAANGAVNDVLELAGTQSGGTAITLGAQFTEFSTLDFTSGAAWTVDVGAGAASITGLAINGFVIGDTIDFTNLTPTQVAADFNPTTNVLTSLTDGTLNFSGISGEQFLLSGDGSGGTDMVLAHNPITSTITLGAGGYPNSLIITATGAVAPTADGAIGVVSNVAGNSLTNFGSIQGGASTSGIGGAAVSFSAAGTLINNGNITGGTGGSTGGVGAELSAGNLTNNGAISGGVGGASATGGVGVYMTGGALTNNNSITGGITGATAVGSAGVLMIGGTLVNTGSITGSAGGAGGAGVNMSGGALTNGGTITGGTGGAGGVGGRGIGMYGGTLTNNGSIVGGTGGAKAKGAAGVYQYGGTVTNNGNIIGGSGGTNARGAAGVFSKSGTLTNVGTITGGSGTGTGRGWAGLYLNGGTAVTSGTITGGAGGSASGVAGAAVQFGTVASTLVIDPGANFNGQVLANAAVNDTLELSGTQSGGTAVTLGAQFTGFSTLDFASGAAWKVNAGAGAAPTTGLAINGFVLGDTMDITNLTPTQVAADFNPTTNVLSTTSDGTLSFVGPFTNEYFFFSSDANGGTTITLVQGSGVSTPVASTVALGSKGYLSPLTITSTGDVAPTAAGANAVTCSTLGKSLTNNGTVQAATGSGGTTGGSGGVGVDFKAADTLINHSVIAGGTGGTGTMSGGHGGAGVYSAGATLTNGGSITGGNGGVASGKGGLGGAGVFLSGGALTNTGSINGGNGGAGGSTGGGAGAGVFLNAGILTNAGIISGGKGGSGTVVGAAGDAVQFGTVASTLVVDPGAVFNGQVAANSAINDVLELAGNQTGGTPITLGAQFTGFSTLDFASGAAWKVNVDAGASSTTSAMTVEGFAIGDSMDVTNAAPAVVAADFNATTDILSTASDGTLSFAGISGEQFLLSNDGSGGTNMVLAHDPITSTLTLGSGSYPSSLIITSTGAIAPTIAGAAGVISSVPGGALTNFGSIHGGASTSGSGGSGVSWAGGGTLVNYGAISGGNGGGVGGAGVNLSAGTLTNEIGGKITGGIGGYHASGGVGANLTGGALTNTGSIVGGTGGYAASGGTGVLLNGGTLVTSGTIAGGAGGGGGGATGAAVKFGAVASTLIVDPGAIFTGQVAANAAVNDVLELAGAQSGGTALTLGTQFTNFATLAFASGATGTADATKAALTAPHTLSIDGFGIGDKLDITNLATKGSTESFNSTTDVLTITRGATTTIKLQFDSAFAGDHFVLKGDGHGGTNVSLAAGAAVTLADLARDVRTWVSNDRLISDDRFMLAVSDYLIGNPMTDPTAELIGHGGACHSYIDHGVDHLAGDAFK